MKQSIIKSHVYGRGLKPLRLSAKDCASYQSLDTIGVTFDDNIIKTMMDSADLSATMTQGSITTPVQFLQAWAPGLVYTVTIPRKIDELLGITTLGEWADEEIVQGVLEPTGKASLYGDQTSIPLSSWNVNFERRSVVRFELGFEVGRLEQERSGRIRIDTASEKRNASALALDIERNRIGFYGYNNGENRTYGFLNDPALPAYITVPKGASGETAWSSKTFLEITGDIRTLVNQLMVQSASVVNADEADTTLALPVSAVTYLSVTSDYGVSVKDWLSTTYPKIRIVTVPELNTANGGVSGAYLYAEKVEDGSTDGGATFLQAVPNKYFALGVENRAKGYVEDFSNATAGVMCKRPFAVVRATGV